MTKNWKKNKITNLFIYSKTKNSTKNKKGNKNNKKSESESDSDQQYANDDDFDLKNPFDNDEIESFHASQDKVFKN